MISRRERGIVEENIDVLAPPTGPGAGAVLLECVKAFVEDVEKVLLGRVLEKEVVAEREEHLLGPGLRVGAEAEDGLIGVAIGVRECVLANIVAGPDLIFDDGGELGCGLKQLNGLFALG